MRLLQCNSLELAAPLLTEQRATRPKDSRAWLGSQPPDDQQPKFWILINDRRSGER